MPCTCDIAIKTVAMCRQAAAANRACDARRGNVVYLSPDNADDVMIVADLHGNRLNFGMLLEIAAFESDRAGELRPWRPACSR